MNILSLVGITFKKTKSMFLLLWLFVYVIVITGTFFASLKYILRQEFANGFYLLIIGILFSGLWFLVKSLHEDIKNQNEREPHELISETAFMEIP